MNFHIRRFLEGDLDEVVELSLFAWEPVFQSIEQVLGPKIYATVYPNWRKSQREAVETVCNDGEKTTVWVAEADGIVVGFVAYELRITEQTGEVQLLAVHPEYQNHGIGTELNHWVLKEMKASGMKLATVSTGGDASHAPARRAYEKAGYIAWPSVWYCKTL